MGCEVYISRNKDLFNFLRDRKDEIEKEIGGQIEWVDAAVASRIKINKVVNKVLSPEMTRFRLTPVIDDAGLGVFVNSRVTGSYKIF